MVRLVNFSVESLESERRSTAELCALLGAAEPADWPPPLNDDATRDWFLDQLRADPSVALWGGCHVVADIELIDTLVGTAGYKGAPDANGVVEIGYSLVPAYHRRGIGGAMINELVRHAFASIEVRKVTAETPVSFVASRRLLEKSGFAMVGQRDDPEDGELALYEISRVGG